MTRLPAIILVGGLLISFNLDAQTQPAGPRFRETPTGSSPNDSDATRINLDPTIEEFSFSELSLREAFALLRGSSRANLWVNWQTLQAAGVHSDLRVGLHLHHVKVSKAIDALLAATGSEVEPRYAVVQGTIIVTTAADLAKNVEVRVYDIRDLIDPSRPREPQVRAVLNLLENQIDRTSWRDAGGSSGAMREVNGQLIVTQTPENQQRLSGLVADLQTLLAAKPRGTPDRSSGK